jgi:hypothetical protein
MAVTTLFTCLIALSGRASAAIEHKADAKHQAELEKCAKVCADCMRECDACFRHCADLVSGGRKEHVATMLLCADCADFCGTAARVAARGGPLMSLACEACARACDLCAEACEAHASDKQMAACAKSCRECAKSCREMMKDLVRK